MNGRMKDSTLRGAVSAGRPRYILAALRYGGRMALATRIPPIRRVAVLGAGVMGSGIAAHCANAGLPVLLLDLKTELVTRALDKLKKAKPHSLIASNTSGLRLAELLQGRSETFRRNFMVTHFFNPPRYMKLL